MSARFVAIAPNRMPWAGGRVLHDGHVEPLLDQFADVRFDAHVRKHPADNHLPDPTLAQLQDEVIGLGPIYLVRTDHDGLASSM